MLLYSYNNIDDYTRLYYLFMHYSIIVYGKNCLKIITYLRKKLNELNVVILLNFNLDGLPV